MVSVSVQVWIVGPLGRDTVVVLAAERAGQVVGVEVVGWVVGQRRSRRKRATSRSHRSGSVFQPRVCRAPGKST